jgi:spermidine/putrescine transport system ATP-binding protein
LGASNLLGGDVTNVLGDLATITLADAETLSVPVERIPELNGSTRVKVGVRPEKISIATATSSPQPGTNALRGRVRVSTFTGVGNQYLVDTESGVEVTVYAQNIGQASAPRSGEVVVLTWPIEHTFAVRPMVGSDDEEVTREGE